MARWQYHVVKQADRMASAFGHLGSEGWELVALHDKASNWLAGKWCTCACHAAA